MVEFGPGNPFGRDDVMPQLPLSDSRLSTQTLGDGSAVKYLQTELTSDQEIRARALECAVRYHLGLGSRVNLWAEIRDFEDYIRNGK